MSDTRTNIAAVLTPRGAAALAVVRVAGPALASWLAARFSRPIVASRPVHGQLRDERAQVIDDPVAVLAPGGKFVDLCLHGGAWIVESTLALLRRDGFTIVAAAEAVYEAESALEAEILRALPRATTDLALRCLLAQGDAWARFANEHGVTFDGVFTAARPESPAGPLRDRLRAIAADEALWWLLHPPTVAIVGAPNVGKSTLANRLLGRERSIVADLPGTTRDWVGERADLAGLPVLLADTPGIRRTEDAIESAAIRQAAGIVAGADLLLLVLDATRPLSEQQPAIDQFSRAIRVVNKCDVAPTGLSAGGVGVSARTGQGIDALIEQIHRRFGVWELDPDEPRWWTAAQRDRLRQIG